MIIAKKSDVSLHLAAGASAQLLHDIGEWDNLKNENANYRVIKSIIKAWSIYETANSIINSFLFELKTI
ncbi:MAG: hypothetical protein M0P93_09440 [Candidatus Cloacimonetes bacterium]|nr:hypothetical protein [Candidatus Cloacimonadota bacterium]